MTNPDTPLTNFQLDVAELFFNLPAGKGFLLAGGAALVAQRLTRRPTKDLDFFTSPGSGNVIEAKSQFVEAAHARGWIVEPIRESEQFCRLLVRGPEDLLVDIALESKPGMPSTASLAGPTFAPRELAGRKLTALWDRAAARDFVDVYQLAKHFGRQVVLEEARRIDAGIVPSMLADTMSQLQRYADADLRLDPDVSDISALRKFYADWVFELRQLD